MTFRISESTRENLGDYACIIAPLIIIAGIVLAACLRPCWFLSEGERANCAHCMSAR